MPPPDPTAHLAFPIPDELHREMRSVLAALRGDEARGAVPRLIDLVAELTDAGLRAYFLTPVERMRINSLTASSVKMAIGLASRSVMPILRRVVGGLDARQLATLADFMEGLVVVPGDGKCRGEARDGE